jgi:3-dehydroquinate synthase
VSRIRIAPAPQPPVAYDVLIEAGALARLPALLAEAAPAHRYVLIADRNVAPLYATPSLVRLEAAGHHATLHTFEPGEANKSREAWGELTDAIVAAGAGRDAVVVAIGGGVTGDLAGFVAATYLRGVPLVQVPTSLLAMLDSAVGGKTGIDLPAGKNLVGAFHPPRLVVADPLVLETLPLGELRSGLAEAVKHGAIADPAYLEWIGDEARRILARDPDTLATLVHRSVEIKASFADIDPFETGPRKALNFGHTIGHAVEALCEYGVAHGFAVAAGMVAEARIGEALGVTDPGTTTVLRRSLELLGLPAEIAALLPVSRPSEMARETAAHLVALARRDKKARAARTRYTLLARIGEVARTAQGEWSHGLDEAAVERVLAVSLDGNAV